MRRLVTVASVISLLLCLATTVLWVRSHYRWEWAQYNWHERKFSAESNVGYVDFTVLAPDDRRSGIRSYSYDPDVAVGSYMLRPRYGISYEDETSGDTFDGWTTNSHLRVSYWLLAAVFTMTPAAWLIAFFRRRHRSNRGLCPICGYDLTGNTSGKCPECGQPIPQKA
jgi:hypothetical protein